MAFRFYCIGNYYYFIIILFFLLLNELCVRMMLLYDLCVCVCVLGGGGVGGEYVGVRVCVSITLYKCNFLLIKSSSPIMKL